MRLAHARELAGIGSGDYVNARPNPRSGQALVRFGRGGASKQALQAFTIYLDGRIPTP